MVFGGLGGTSEPEPARSPVADRTADVGAAASYVDAQQLYVRMGTSINKQIKHRCKNKQS
eukprot:13967117-Heterocapsa_arctica.AAC.1